MRGLNELGYGETGSGLVLNLVSNPLGPHLPPPRCRIEAHYKRFLAERFGARFNALLTLTNMAIHRRFGSLLLSRGEFHDYLGRLKASHQDENLTSLMCRNLLSVDWRGVVFDCDFNQMLDLPLGNGRGIDCTLRTSARLHWTAGKTGWVSTVTAAPRVRGAVAAVHWRQNRRQRGVASAHGSCVDFR